MSRSGSQSFAGAAGLRSPPPTGPRQRVFYAVVQHDFEAERTDELDARAGDHISVVAQSNLEWFVAKHINKLGRPGLIPVSFVAVHDPTTGTAMSDETVKELMERGDIPKVEEWKRLVIGYKETSISLGTLDENRSPTSPSAYNPYAPMPPAQSFASAPPQHPQPHDGVGAPPTSSSTPQSEEPPESSNQPLDNGIILSAEVLSWHYEVDEYWFRIHALFQPNGDGDYLPPAKQLLLFRVYNDFYNLQHDLLRNFPVEGGQQTIGDSEPSRILPYMPGPSQHVDDKVTQLRKDELDQYLQQLCSLWEQGAEHILRHRLILDFFSPKAGDLEEEVNPAYSILEERAEVMRKGGSKAESNGGDEDVDDQFARMNLQGGANHRTSEGSRYDEQYAADSPKAARRSVNGNGYGNGYAHRPQSNFSSNSRAQSPMHKYSGSTASAIVSPSGNAYEQNAHYGDSRYRSGDEDSPRSYSSGHGHGPPMSAAPSNGSRISSTTRSRSGSLANVINSPPISASNPNAAYVKIKVLDHVTQEIIALRVHPLVTQEQLMDKVRQRLGSDVERLAYRNSVTNNFIAVDDDQGLADWLNHTDKHVLYAD